MTVAKNRVSQHSGRKGSAKHNNRDYDYYADKSVNPDLVGANIIYPAGYGSYRCPESKKNDFVNFDEPLYNATHKPMTKADADKISHEKIQYDLVQAESKIYADHFSRANEIVNARYIAQRHPEKCRTIKDWQNSTRNGPEETILRIGDKMLDVPTETLQSCMTMYLDFMQEWNKEHGDPIVFLGGAIHVDEAGGKHGHYRRSWAYRDENGVEFPDQDKALEKAGVELPDPTKKKSRYNNRKVTFDKMMRAKWIEIVQQHGYDVETVPIPNQRTKETKDFVYDREKDYIARVEALGTQEDAIIGNVKKQIDDANKLLNDREAKLDTREDSLNKREKALDAQEADLSARLKEIQLREENTLKIEIRAKNAYLDAGNTLAAAQHILQGANSSVAAMVAPPGLEEFCKTYKRRIAKTKMKDVGTALKPDYKRVYDLDKDGKKQYEEHNCYNDWQASLTAKRQSDRLTRELLDQADEMQRRQQDIQDFDFTR